MVEWLFLAVPWGCLRLVIVVFPDHTRFLLFGWRAKCYLLFSAFRRDRFRFANFANVVIKFKTSQIGLDNPSYSPEDDDYEVIG